MLSILENINIWAVIMAAIVNAVMGNFWYSPLILGNPWMKEHGFTEADFIKGHSLWLILLLTFVFAFVAAFAIAVFIGPQSTALSGAGMGAVIALCWISTSKANLFLFENHSLKLFLIHAGYDILRYMVMGAIVGAWHL
jgi:hypothetical protein